MIGISPSLWTLRVHVTVDEDDICPASMVRGTQGRGDVRGMWQLSALSPFGHWKDECEKMLPMRNNTQASDIHVCLFLTLPKFY